MGNQSATAEEEQLSEEEKKLDLAAISPQDVFRAFTSFLPENSMHEDDFFKFAKAQRINLDNTSIVPHQQDFYFAFRASTHHYKPRLALVAFTLFSNASDDVKADTLFSAYSTDGQCPIEMVKVILYNMIDVSLNVSKRLVPENVKIAAYLEELRRGRKLMFRSVAAAIGQSQVTKELFRQVMVRDEFKSVLTSSGVRQRLRKLLNDNQAPSQPLPFVPTIAG